MKKIEEHDDDMLYPAGFQPLDESQRDDQDETDMLFPAGVGRKRKQDDNGVTTVVN